MSENLKDAALAYHRSPKPGKLEIQATKPLANQRDLALAYSPGVAYACEEIAADPAPAMQRQNHGERAVSLRRCHVGEQPSAQYLAVNKIPMMLLPLEGGNRHG